MAYNYGNYGPQQPNFTGYNQQYPTQNFTGYVPNPYQQPQPQTQNQNSAGFVWVQGEAAAKAYPVAAGNSVLLMDSDAPVLYMKSTDYSGKPLPLEIYDLVKRDAISSTQAAPQPQIDLSEYVTQADLEAKVKEMIKKALNE